MFQIIAALILIWIVWSVIKAKKRASSSMQNSQTAEETKYIAITELGIPQDYYNKILLDKKKWKYVREYADCLRNHGNSAEAVLIKADIRGIDINECCWSRLLAFGIADLYNAEKPYIEMNERLMAFKKTK